MGWRSQPTQRPKGVGDTPGLPIASRGPDIVPLIGSRRRDQLEEAPQPSSGIWSRSAGVTNWPLPPMSAAASLDFLPGGECRDVVKTRPSCNLWRSVLAPTSDNAMCLTYPASTRSPIAPIVSSTGTAGIDASRPEDVDVIGAEPRECVGERRLRGAWSYVCRNQAPDGSRRAPNLTLSTTSSNESIAPGESTD